MNHSSIKRGKKRSEGEQEGRLAQSPAKWLLAHSLGGQLERGLAQGLCTHLLTLLPLLAAHITEDTSDLLQHVKFQSSNFENILTWDGKLESAPDTVYSVQYKT